MNSPIAKNASPAASGFNFRDMLFVVFKHKWKISFLAVIGIAGAAALFAMQRPLYASQAKLMVRYVIERSPVDPYENQRGTSGRGGDHVLIAETEILSSTDLALEVAEKVGPEKLLPEGEEPSLQLAAGKITSGLEVETGKGSNVIQVIYKHENPEIAAVALRTLVQCYFEKHLEIHRALGASDYVQKQADKARSQLLETEQRLKSLKSDSGIISVSASTESLQVQRGRLQEALLVAEAELVEQATRLKSLEEIAGLRGSPGADGLEDGSPAEPAGASREDLVLAAAEYQDVAAQLNYLRQRRNELLARYTSANPLVTSTQRQINLAESQRRSLISRFPGLIQGPGGGAPGADETPGTDLGMERARFAAIEAKVKALKAQQEEIGRQIEELSKVGGEIVALERRRALEEEKSHYLESALERARADASLDPSKMPNITMIQNPTAPARTFDQAKLNLVYGLAVGGLVLGLGISFLIEMVIDPRVKRPAEIQTRLQLPLIMTIPHLRARKRDRVLALEPGVPLLANRDDGSQAGLPVVSEGPSGSGHFIKTYVEALRDRIIFNFGVNNITHKPKIIGVAGLSEGAGASTIAAGLAKAFAEAPGMKVLFVDLSAGDPAGNPIFGDARPLSLPRALEAARGKEFREGRNDLIYASAAAGPQGIVPLQLHEMMPYIRFSDFDYIVFDLPALHQTSPTLAMAGLMDKVLLVLDAESTTREALQWGYSELERGRADVSCVYNKARVHAPKWVLGEI